MPETPETPKKRARRKSTAVSSRPAWPDRFLQHLATHGAISPAAKETGIGRATVYREMDRDPEFRADVGRVLEGCVEQVESTLFQMALMPLATTDRIFYLKARKPEVYGDKLRQDQIEQIKREARQAALAEIRDELAQLTPQARELVMAAMATARERRQLTP